MFYDFKLSNNGDILFKFSNKQEQSLQVDFYTSPTKGLVFDFYIDSYYSEQYLPNLVPQFAFQFNTECKANDKEILTITDEQEYIYQQIKIRLSSVLGSIQGNEQLGSKLEKYKHMLLNPKKENNYEELIACVRDAIKDVLPNAEITVINNQTIYTDFTNSLIISIIYNDYSYYFYL